jgi:hypothetical protein
MPTPVAEQDLMWRLGDYLDDVDWRNIRVDHNGAPERAVDLGFDPAFRDALVILSTQHPEKPSTLWRKHVPTDFPTSLMDELVLQDRHAGQQGRDVARLGMPEALPEANEIIRDRDRETGVTPSVQFAQNRGDIDSRESDTRQPPPLPSFVRRHFVRTGDRFYYRQTPERLAFTVRGETLRAEDASVSVATALVELAESRGWSALRVKGSQEFRRLVWATAIKRGLSVEGYSPSAGERAMLEQEPEPRDRRQGSNRTESRTGGRERPIDSLTGVLVGHGAAPYQHQQSNSPSYFVSLRGPSDEVATHWGLDLERALGESGATVGDRVQLARLGKQRIPVRNDSGHVIGHESNATDRSAWSATVRKRGSLERANPNPKDRGQIETLDPIASKVVELFTSERLARFLPEDRTRFRDLYNQAKARLETRDAAGESAMPSTIEIARRKNRERTAPGR